MAAGIYANTLGHGYVLDDKAIITQNSFTQQGFAGISEHFTHSYWFGINGKDEGNYRPISGVSFSIERAVFGTSPAVGHFFNMLFYALLCVVLLRWLLMLQLFSPLLTFGAVLLFAAHPVHTEVVANIKSRDEIYCMLFFVLSAIQFQKWLNDKKPIQLGMTGFFFLLSMLSKETSIALLLIFPLLAFRSKPIMMDSIKSSLVPLATVVVYLSMYFSVTDLLADRQYHVFDNALVQSAAVSDILATKFWILGDYIRLLFIPYPLVYDYSFNTIPVVTFSNLQVLITIVLLLALVVWRGRQFKHRLESTSQNTTLMLALFILPLFPVSNFFITIGTTMAERLLFMPSLGFVLLFIYGLSKLFGKLKLPTEKLSLLSISVLVALASLTTMTRNKAWASDEVLFSTDLKHLTDNAKVHHNLANIYKAKAEKATNQAQKVTFYESAARLIEQASSIYEVQEFHHELGLIYGELGKWEGVKKSMGRYLEMNPNDATAWMQLGIAYGISQEMPAALSAFEKAYAINPKDADICLNLAKTYAMLNRLTDSKNICDGCLQIAPENQELLQLNAQLAQSLGL
jgi:protein O-mannosyl-transferase